MGKILLEFHDKKKYNLQVIGNLRIELLYNVKKAKNKSKKISKCDATAETEFR